MRHLTLGFVLCCLLLAAPAVQAQLVSPLHVIPVVAKAAGVGGSDWRSDLAISNVSAEAVEVGISFFREETAHSPFDLLTFDQTVTIQPGATLLVEDVLGTWFAGEGNTKGFLLVAATGLLQGIDDAQLAVASRTYNAANPNATYGQTVPSTITAVLVGPGRIIMAGAREDSRFRSNVGVLNVGLRATEVVITIFDGTGSQLAQRTKTIQAMSMGQWSLSSLGVSSLPGAGRVEVRLASSEIPDNPCEYEIDLGSQIGLIAAYLSKNDNATSDAELVLGQVDWADYVSECGTTPDGCR